MARISTYALDAAINDADKLIGTDADNNNQTKNFSLEGIAEYVIDRLIDPDANQALIPVFRNIENTDGANATRITGSIMSQDTYPTGTKITIAGDLTLERDQSDTTLTIISDASNIGENNNPSIKFIQDGGSQNAAIGFNIIDDTVPDGLGNRFWIINSIAGTDLGDGGITFGTAQVDGWDNAIGRFIIRGDGKGLFGHPDSLYNKTLGSQFEIYDNRDENTTTDPSFSVYSVVDVAAPSGNEGAGGIKQILDVYNSGVFQQQEALMLIPGTNASDFAASTPIAFYTNSDMDTSSPSGFAGIIFDSGNWLLDGSGTFTTLDPGYQLKVEGTALITDNTNIDGDLRVLNTLTVFDNQGNGSTIDGLLSMSANRIIDLSDPINAQDAATKSYVDTAVTGLLDFKGTFRADTGEILSGASAGAFIYNCPGGAGTRVDVAVGDYYIVANAGGNFYCSGDLLNIGDSVYGVVDATGNTSTINDWGTVEGDNIEGSGTTNTIPLWTAGQALGDSVLSQETGTAYGTTKNLVVDGNIHQSNMGNSVSIGENALANGVAGTDAENVAIGLNALNSLTTATNNIGIGANTLQSTNANNNIAIGKNSQQAQTAGLGNISLGFNSLSGNNVKNSNVVIGHTAMQNVGTGATGITGNVVLGTGAVNATTITGGLFNNVILGVNALEQANAANIYNAVFIGDGAGRFIEANATSDIGIGASAFYGTNSGFNSAGDNIAIGANANGSNTQTGVRRSIKIGSDAGTAGSYAVNISAVNTNSYNPNYVLGEHAVIIGGANNSIQGAEAAFMGGGRDNTIASGAIGGAILGGYDNTVSSGGSAGMALGSNLIVDGENQVVVGRYNTGNNNSKFIVGAGFSNANRINAFEVKNTSQLKLGKYGGTQFTQPGATYGLYNLLTVSVTGNVNEIPAANLNPQNTEATSYTLNPAGVLNLPSDSSTRLVKISWGSVNNGTAIVRLPLVSNFPNKTIQIITDGSFDVGAGKKVLIEGSFGAGNLIDGAGQFELSKKYEGVTLWSDGIEWFIIQSKAH
jgi:hypothetical protein